MSHNRFRYDVGPQDFTQFPGRFVRVKDDDGNPVVVEIEEVLPSLAHACKLQINSKEKSYLISALDFFAQMNNEYVSPQEIALFDETTFEIGKNRKDRRAQWAKLRKEN